MNNLFISDNSKIGMHCTIHKFTQILEGAVIGDCVTIGHNVFIGDNVVIGNHCKIQGNVFIPEGCNIQDNVFIGPGTTFCNVKHPEASIKSDYMETIVENNVMIGANCTILPGLKLGSHSVLGAGSVLTKNLPSKTTAYGNPAFILL